MWIIWVGWFFVVMMFILAQESLGMAIVLFLILVALPLLLILMSLKKKVELREAHARESVLKEDER